MELYLDSLGCVRNLVDSEIMLARLAEAGWSITSDPVHADVIVINTCSFIEDAINESIDTILDLAKFKHQGNCRMLVVAGCLPERFREEIIETLPEVDVFLGTGGYDRIVDAVNGTLNEIKCHLPDPDAIPISQTFSRIRSVAHLAYLKIGEGCSRHCTYCIIPKLRGKQKSRPLKDIVSEAQALVSSGGKELVLVSQDTTNYGRELHDHPGLAQLLSSIAKVSNGTWIRFLYGHPESIDDSIIRTVSEHKNICSYFDIPIQHASNKILKRMGRKYSQKQLLQLFDTIRSILPEAVLRTTVMIGFPGETDKDFDELLKIVESVRFNHLGVFIYSDSEDLPSHRLSGHVSKQTAQKRYDRLMSRQMDISLEYNKKQIGKILNVLVEEKVEKNLYEGRTSFQSPEVDGITYIYSDQLPIGEFTRIRIIDALEYDLVGEPV